MASIFDGSDEFKNFERNNNKKQTLKEKKEEMNEAQQVSTFWIYLYRCSKLGPRSIWRKQEVCTLEEQSRAVCDKAIRHRMERVSIDHSPIKSLNIREKPPEAALNCIYNMMDVLVASNPELYSDVTFKMNIPMQDERTVCKAYSDFAESLFRKGTTWPLITALFAFSGSLAAECTRSGRSILVRSICDWATIFIVMRLKDWIRENGGWEGVVNYFGDQSLSAGQCASTLIKTGKAQIRKASLLLVNEEHKKKILENCLLQNKELTMQTFLKDCLSSDGTQRLFLLIAFLLIVLCATSVNFGRTYFYFPKSEVSTSKLRCDIT